MSRSQIDDFVYFTHPSQSGCTCGRAAVMKGVKVDDDDEAECWIEKVKEFTTTGIRLYSRFLYDLPIQLTNVGWIDGQMDRVLLPIHL